MLKKSFIKIQKIDKCSLFFGFVFATLYVVGKSIYELHNFQGIVQHPYISFIRFVLVMVLTALALSAIGWGVDKLISIKGTRIQVIISRLTQERITWIVLWVVMLIPYMVSFLAFYPGIFAYDVGPQTSQAIGIDAWSNFHPVPHTLVWTACVTLGQVLGSNEMALAIYSLLQIFVVTIVNVYVIYTLAKKHGHVIIGCIGFMYYLLNPMFWVFSVAMTKDVLFADFVLLYFMSVLDLQKDGSKKNIVFSVIWGLLAALFRNNMIYAIMFMLVVTVFLKYKRSFYIATITIVLAYFLVTKVLYPMCGVKGTLPHEAMSVPISQLAYIYLERSETLTEHEKEIIKLCIPNPKEFNPRIADRVKISFYDDWYSNHKSGFWSVYWSVFLKNPEKFIHVFLDLNVDYWYVGADFPDPYSKRTYIETNMNIMEEFPIDRYSKQEKVLGVLTNFADFKAGWMQIPLIKNFFLISFPMVSMILYCYMNIKNKCKNIAFVYLTLIGLFLTYILGPVSNFRYMFPFYLGLPLYMGVLLDREIQNDIKN